MIAETNCPDGPHRPPEGPNEDLGQCRRCLAPSHSMRPDNEQIGLHRADCSLPRRHPGHCAPGGAGHAPAEIVRGYWLGYEDDIAAARTAHPEEA